MTQLDPLSRALLSAAAGCHEPSQADRVRVRRRLITRLGVAVGLGALGAAATRASPAMAAAGSSAAAESPVAATLLGSAKLLALGKVVGVSAAIGAAGFGGYEWVASAIAPRAHAAVGAAASETARPIATEIARAANRAPLGSIATERQQRQRLEQGETSPARAAEHAASGSPSVQRPLREIPQSTSGPALPPVAAFPSDAPNLAAEARGLARAQAALREGNPAQALSLLDQQGALYSDGSLAEERSAARVFALCKVGRIQDANEAAGEFLRRSPHSVLAERVANACPHPK